MGLNMEAIERAADALVERPILRTLAMLSVVGVSTAISYGVANGFEIPASEHNADVEACARLLGRQAAHVRAPDMPDPCRPFETSFAFHDVTVRVVGPTSTDYTHRRTYDTPPVSDFRAANIETPAEAAQDEAAARDIALSVGGIGTILALGGSLVVPGVRRRRDEKPTKSATS